MRRPPSREELDADLVTAPFRCPKAFSAGMFELAASDVVGLLADASQSQYARELLGERAKSVVPAEPTCVLTTFRAHVCKILRYSGPAAVLREDYHDPGREILLWRQLSLRLPSVIFRAAMPGPRPVPPSVRVLPAQLAPRGPIAHLHFHSMASLDFQTLWSHVLRAKTGPMAKSPGRREIGIATNDFSDAAFWRWLRRAAIVRHSLLARLTKQDADRGHLLEHEETVSTAWNELLEAREIYKDEQYEILLSRANSALEHDGAVLRRPDRFYREENLVRALFDASSDTGARDVCRVGVQYLRLMTALFASVTLGSREAKFSDFQLATKRLRKHAVPSGLRSYLVQNGDATSQCIEENAVEPRCAPQELRTALDELEKVDSRLASRVSLIVHLIRHSPCGRGSVISNCSRLEVDAAKVIAVMNQPSARKWLRGIDLAGDEIQGPLWMAIPVLRDIRQNADSIGMDVPHGPIGLTLHVGEVFPDIATGLRAVDEPLLWRLVRRGDRLGHATALAIHPDVWRARPEVEEKCEVPWSMRVFDLAWLLHWMRSVSGVFHAEHAECRSELRRLLDVAGFRRIGVDDVVESYVKDLGSGDPLRKWCAAGGMEQPDFGAAPGRLAFLSTFWSRWGEEDMHVPVSVDEKYDRVLDVIRCAVRVKVARMQIAVEISPSSSYILQDAVAPLFQSDLARVATEADAISVAIAADDPLTFATTLSDEYAYAWAGLVVLAQVAPSKVNQWLQECASVSWRARFAVARD